MKLKSSASKSTDIKFIKEFVKSRNPRFVRELQLEMEIYYLMGLCHQFLKGNKTLFRRLPYSDELVSAETYMANHIKEMIEKYLTKYGEQYDRDYYYNMKNAYEILTKYYLNEQK